MQAFDALGLQDVRIDAVGNVVGRRPGRSARPHLLLTAHLDTVFPEGTDVRVARDGHLLRGPGIGDNCRGLAVLLAVIGALRDAGVSTPGSITFAATVGEEGLGDLRGVKQLLAGESKGTVDYFVSIDGGGLDITHVAVGSRRYRVSVKGPGGHSYGSFGIANPVHALGRAIAVLADFEVSAWPKTTFNVGRVGGGTSVNSIAGEAWMEVDLRSADAAALAAIDRRFDRAVDAAVEQENRRWSGRGRLTVVKERVGDRPAGRTPERSAIVQTAIAATRALGLPVELTEGSTDSNFPISLGVPAVTIGGGGEGRAAHSPGEVFDTTESWKGTQRAALLAIALAER
jgi:acetylornithine deacetylase/succinyl-diaminopimelate desuccinylase-like protein